MTKDRLSNLGYKLIFTICVLSIPALLLLIAS